MPRASRAPSRRTYSTLISKGRLAQLVAWVGGPTFAGPIVLDECHKGAAWVHCVGMPAVCESVGRAAAWMCACGLQRSGCNRT